MTAAQLSRHPFAVDHTPGQHYAFALREDVTVGPWSVPDDADEAYPGQSLVAHCRDRGMRDLVYAQAIGSDPGVSFEFNGQTITCPPVSALDDEEIAATLRRQWEQKSKEASDAYWTPERLAEQSRRMAEQRARTQAAKVRVAEALAAFPFRPTDSRAYAEYKANNSDGYGGAVVSYGEGWAALMESAIRDGATVAEAADATRDEADTEGISGFMYGCAVAQLAHWWKHGEELRRWHNGEYGHDGDGIVNPAFITVSVAE